MNNLNYSHIGQWVKVMIETEEKIGRVKSYDNTKKIAWVIFEGADKNGNDWKDGVSLKSDYQKLTFIDNPTDDKK